MGKPYSAACDRNSGPLLAVLSDLFEGRSRVLEIGSGTGQHAVHFARALPDLVWQSSDVPEQLHGVRQWLDEASLRNTPAPIAFDVNASTPEGRFDAIFSANTLHIMSWREVERLFEVLPRLMSPWALLTVYGPFNYRGAYTSAGNAAFDAALRADRPDRGLRDLEAVDALAGACGLALLDNRAMPANNRCITWRLDSSRQT